MKEPKLALTKAIAILLSVTPQTQVGKLLKLCEDAKVESEVAGKTALQMARFVEQLTSLSYWIQDIITADFGRIGDYRHRKVFRPFLAGTSQNKC